MGHTLRSHRVRQLVRLVAETHSLSEPRAQRQHLLRGICDLIGAVVCVYSRAVDFRGDGRGWALVADETGWDSERQRQLVSFAYVIRGSTSDPSVAALAGTLPVGRPGVTLCRTRTAWASDTVWYNSEHWNDYLRPAGIDHMLHSVRRIGTDDRVDALSLHRATSDPPFDDEAAMLMEILHRELRISPALMKQAPVAPTLSPRQRQTLACLLDGCSEKEAAHRMGISVHTCHQYVKVLYRRFGVHSRAELFNRCVLSASAQSETSPI